MSWLLVVLITAVDLWIDCDGHLCAGIYIRYPKDFGLTVENKTGNIYDYTRIK